MGISIVPENKVVPYILADQSPQTMADKNYRSLILCVSTRWISIELGVLPCRRFLGTMKEMSADSTRG